MPTIPDATAHARDAAASGLLVVDKPAGWTSHQVVGRVRRLMGTRKVGHAGTLDPMATGVLLIGVNRATRLLGHLALHDKSYEATIRLGLSTSTDDAEGEPSGGEPASGLDLDAVRRAMAPYRGEIDQVPSSVSAIKVDGQRSYARVRAGEQVELAARRVTVSRYDLLDARIEGDFLDLDVVVDCSSGTYIRALARDLGRDLGVGGHLTALRRTRIGHYSIDEATPIVWRDEPDAGPAPRPDLMTMAQAAALSFPVVHVDEQDADHVAHGRGIGVDVDADPTAVVGPTGELLALFHPTPHGARPVCVLV